MKLIKCPYSENMKCANMQCGDCEIYKVYNKALDDFKEYLLSHKKLVREFETNYVYESVKIEFISDTNAEELKVGDKNDQ